MARRVQLRTRRGRGILGRDLMNGGPGSRLGIVRIEQNSKSFMDLIALSQVTNPVLQTVCIVVIGLGYYYTVRATWATV
jgi:hypothetical protein